MQIKPSKDPFFRHRHQYILRPKKPRRNKAVLWTLLFLAILIAAAYYAYQWLNFTAFDLQALIAQFKAEQVPPSDADQARLENPQDIARQALKPTSPEQAAVKIPRLNDATQETTTQATDSVAAQTSVATPTAASTTPPIANPAANTNPPNTTLIVDDKVLNDLQQPATNDDAATDKPDANAVAENTSTDTSTAVATDTETAANPASDTATPNDGESIEIAQGQTSYSESAGGITVNINIDPIPTPTPQADIAIDMNSPQAARIKALQQKATQQIEAQKLEAALKTYEKLQVLEPTLASPVRDAIFLAYQQQVEAHLQVDELDQALEVYATMQQHDAEHLSVTAALDAIMGYYQAIMHDLTDRQRLLSGEDSAWNLYQKVSQFAPQHPTLQTMQAELLQALLRMAQLQVEAQKYTTPENNNALSTYRAILALVPNHLGAEEGLRNLAQVYEGIVKTHLAKENFMSAKNTLQRGQEVLPEYPAWQKLNARIDKAWAAKNPQEALTQRAKQQLEAGKLTHPAGDNAYETFQELQAQFPDDAYAKSAINLIADRYAELAEEKRQAKELKNSMALINEGLALMPNHAALKKLKQQVLADY